MSKPARVQIVIPVYVSVFVCNGCGVRVPGVVHATEIHRRLVGVSVNFIEDVPDGAHIAVNTYPPDGWQRINIPGKPRQYDTDGYCCPQCAEIIQHVVEAALITAQTAISVNNLNVQNAFAPPLQGTIVDERQTTIPHEFVSTDNGAGHNHARCDICTLTETECRARQAVITA